MSAWDPRAYLAFDDDRARPFDDLLARVGAPSTGPGAPRRVVDLGCGPGQLVARLHERWPHARIDALDASPEMVAAAHARGVDAREQRAEDWTPGPEDDVVITNAVLHWVPDHRALIPRWIAALPPGSWFAMQVPGNAASPAHTLAAELAGHVDLGGAGTIGDAAEYADLLADAAGVADVDAWDTTYLHRLTGDDPVLRWITSTTLRPVREALPDAEYAEFEAALAPRLRAAYPQRTDGTTWFPFRRVFAVARRAG